MIHLYLNGTDVSKEYAGEANGYSIYLAEKSLTTLMCPVPNKAYLENKPTLGHGKKILASQVYKDERNVTLTFGIKAKDKTHMLNGFKKLTEILYAGKVELKTSFDTSVVYKLYYESCSQIQTFFRGIALFDVKFVEPDPSDRT